MPTHHLKTKDDRPKKEQEENICFFGQTNFRNQLRRFGMKLDDRRRHTYVIGKTGMGKTTLMENMVLHDIYNGNGVGIVDPHGDFSEKIIDYIPSHRINDVIYLNPADVDFPIGFNILEVQDPAQKHLIVQGLMATFKKIWPDAWSSRMEYILNNTLLALLDYPNSTLLGINRLLGDNKFRKKIVAKLEDPVVRSFWRDEFDGYDERYRSQAVAPIQNKIGQFLSANVIRNMVAQVKSTIDIREAMDNKKILIMNLSKGRIGEDNSRLLGGMLITKIQLSAMERVDIPEEDRQDFFLYVDEFQNFATPSFANILSEARKYRLGLIMAHQYVAQLDEVVADAVFGNVGTILTFRVGAADAEFLSKEFYPTFTEEDIINLPKFQIFLKLMIDGVASSPFSANTLAPIGHPTGSREKVIQVSRERYGRSREDIVEKIERWSSGDGTVESMSDAKKSTPNSNNQNNNQNHNKSSQHQSGNKGGNNNQNNQRGKHNLAGQQGQKQHGQSGNSQPPAMAGGKPAVERGKSTHNKREHQKQQQTPKQTPTVSLKDLTPRNDVTRKNRHKNSPKNDHKKEDKRHNDDQDKKANQGQQDHNSKKDNSQSRSAGQAGQPRSSHDKGGSSNNDNKTTQKTDPSKHPNRGDKNQKNSQQNNNQEQHNRQQDKSQDQQGDTPPSYSKRDISKDKQEVQSKSKEQHSQKRDKNKSSQQDDNKKDDRADKHDAKKNNNDQQGSKKEQDPKDKPQKKQKSTRRGKRGRGKRKNRKKQENNKPIQGKNNQQKTNIQKEVSSNSVKKLTLADLSGISDKKNTKQVLKPDQIITFDS